MYLTITCAIILLSLSAIESEKDDQPRPNIIFIVADDLGWNDVGWHNSDVKTPILDSLAHGGLIMDQSYVTSASSPSRAAFLSGIYPHRLGINKDIPMTERNGLTLDAITLPQRLQILGYRTHMVGKWHLGFCDWRLTPRYRGFNSFYGFYTGTEFYFAHDFAGCLDLRDNEFPDWKQKGVYSTTLFADKSIEKIENHDASEPFFLYLAFQAVHKPLEVPGTYLKLYSGVKDKKRKKYCAMVTEIDTAVGRIMTALEKKKMQENTIVVFTTANGAQEGLGGNNLPLRGQRSTLWEGGTRAVTFIHSPMIQNPRRVYWNLFHAVDWMPTLLSAAGEEVLPIDDLDGVSHWTHLKSGEEDLTPPREEFVYQIFPESAAIRFQNFKLIINSATTQGGWYPVDDLLRNPKYSAKAWSSPKFLLINLRHDPTERANVAKWYPEIVEMLDQKVNEYRKKAKFAKTESVTREQVFRKELNGCVISPGWCLVLRGGIRGLEYYSSK